MSIANLNIKNINNRLNNLDANKNKIINAQDKQIINLIISKANLKNAMEIANFLMGKKSFNDLSTSLQTDINSIKDIKLLLIQNKKNLYIKPQLGKFIKEDILKSGEYFGTLTEGTDSKGNYQKTYDKLQVFKEHQFSNIKSNFMHGVATTLDEDQSRDSVINTKINDHIFLLNKIDRNSKITNQSALDIIKEIDSLNSALGLSQVNLISNRNVLNAYLSLFASLTETQQAVFDKIDLNKFNETNRLTNKNKILSENSIQELKQIIRYKSNTNSLISNNKIQDIIKNIFDKIFVDSMNSNEAQLVKDFIDYKHMDNLINLISKNTKAKEHKKNPRLVNFNEMIEVRKALETRIINTHAGTITFNLSDSLPYVANNVKLDDIPEDMRNLPVNEWCLKNKNDKILHTYVGSFYHKNSDINEKRAETFIDRIIKNNSSKDNKYIIIDFRLLYSMKSSNNLAKPIKNNMTEQHILDSHEKVMKNVVEKLNTKNKGSNIHYLMTHVPVSGLSSNKYVIKVFSYLALNGASQSINQSLTKINELRKSDVKNIYTIIEAKIRSVIDDLKLQIQLLNVASELKRLLLTTPTAASGLLVDTLATILSEHLEGVHIITGCKSAKDRTSAEFVAMQALKAVIDNKIKNDIYKGSVNAMAFIQNLVIHGKFIDKFNVQIFSPEDLQIFRDNYDDKMLYIANLVNNGILTNVNTREFDMVLEDVLNISKYIIKVES